MSRPGAMWGVIPAAGVGSRIQPLAFSKELLPLGSRMDRAVERPRAVSEYLIERMILAGVTRLCFVIAPGKSDIVGYYGAGVGAATTCYVVQPRPGGLCDAVFRARPLVHPDDVVLVGLPDTVWFPEDGFCSLVRGGDGELSFLLFPVDQPELFDAVITARRGDVHGDVRGDVRGDGGGDVHGDVRGDGGEVVREAVREVQVKQPGAATRWVWGAFCMSGAVLHELGALWQQPGRGDEYIGTLVNAYLAQGGRATAVRGGEAYVDVGTVHGYRRAIQLLDSTIPRAGDAK